MYRMGRGGGLIVYRTFHSCITRSNTALPMIDFYLGITSSSIALQSRLFSNRQLKSRFTRDHRTGGPGVTAFPIFSKYKKLVEPLLP